MKKTMKTAKPQTIEQEHRWSIDRSAQMSPDKSISISQFTKFNHQNNQSITITIFTHNWNGRHHFALLNQCMTSSLQQPKWITWISTWKSPCWKFCVWRIGFSPIPPTPYISGSHFITISDNPPPLPTHKISCVTKYMDGP